MRRIRQTTGEKQTFLVQARSYRIILGSASDAMVAAGLSQGICGIRGSCGRGLRETVQANQMDLAGYRPVW